MGRKGTMGKHKDRKLYILSDMQNFELTILVGDAEELANYLDTSPDAINRTQRNNALIKRRYKIFEYEGDDQEDE